MFLTFFTLQSEKVGNTLTNRLNYDFRLSTTQQFYGIKELGPRQNQNYKVLYK